MSRSWRSQRRREFRLRKAALAAVLVIFLLPLAWTVLAAIGFLPNNSRRPPTWTLHLTLDHFAEVGIAAPSFWIELATSTGVSLGAALVTVAASFLGAYGLARSRWRGERTITQGFLVLASLPAMAFVIPLADLMRRVNLVDNVPGLLLGEAAVTAPLAVYVLRGFLSGLSPEWEEAARLDGASLLTILRGIVLPMAAPTVVATAVILFVMDWNMLLVPLVLSGVAVKTLPVAMIDFFTFERGLDWPTAAAALVISLVPLLVLIAALHRILDRFTLGGGTSAAGVVDSGVGAAVRGG